MIVTLAANTDYLKRLLEIVADVNKGLTQTELDNASKAAQDEVMSALVEMGFSVSGFTTTGNTPYLVIEIIKKLASAMVWNRALMLYMKDVRFEDTFGSSIYQQSLADIDRIASRKVLIAQNGSVIRPSAAEGSKGVPRWQNRALGIVVPLKAIDPNGLDRFISEHSQELPEYPTNPFDRL